jgi:hypothetical protein
MSDMLDLVQAIGLEDVRLVRLDAGTRVRSVRDLGGRAAETPVGWGVQIFERNAELVFARVSVSLRMIPKAPPEQRNGDAPEDALFINCVFELRYRLPSEFDAAEEDLNEFVQTSGVFHAWPYARELVSNTLGRMRLPPITLPLFKPSEQFGSDEHEDEDGPSSAATADAADTATDSGRRRK